MKRLIAILCVLAMVLTAVPATVFAGGSVILPPDHFTTDDDKADFVILSTTDMHGKCWDTNVLTDGAESNNMLKVKTAVNQIRTSFGADNVLLIDNGDLYQGTPVSSVQLNQYTQGLSEEPLAMAVCLADIGYTASGLGNHEFNYPWKTMQDARAYLLANGVPTVCANLYFEETGENAFTPYITKNITVGSKTLKVGILGLESTDCTRWDIPDNYPGIIFHHPDNPDCSIAWEAEHYIPAMKADGCDFIIVAYHGGTGSAAGDLVFGTNTESQATRLIAQTEGIDMVIAGHDHSTGYTNTYIKNKNGKDVLIVNGGGTQLTKTVLTATAGDSGISVTVKSTENLALSSFTSDTDLKAKIKPYADLASDYVNQEAGKCIGTWDKETNFYLKQSDSMDLIQAAQMYEATKHIAQKFNTPEKQAALFEATGLDHLDVDMSSTSVVVSGSYCVKAGSMTMKDIYRLYKYDNSLYILPLTGAQIKAVLEQNASTRLKATVKNGKVSYSTIGENFTNPVFGGLNFTYDMYQPEGSRVIIDGFANGREFDLEKTYLVGVNNYHLGNVGCGFGAYATTDAVWSQTDDMGGGVVQDLILEYLTDITAEKGGVDPATFNWSWKLDYTGDPSEEQGPKGDIIAKEVTELYDGQKIMIYCGTEGVVMGTEPAENPARLGGVSATISGDYLGTNAPAAIFTVTAVPTPGDDIQPFTFALVTESGNILTSGATGNSLGFSAELSDLGRWYLEEADGGFHIMNVGAAYNGNHNQALEWYTGFTTYGVQNTAAFLFNLYEPIETASVAEALEDGGKYAIYFDAEETFISTEELNGGLAPVTNTVAGGKLILPADAKTLIFKAEIVATNGETPIYTFKTDDGKYLTAGDTGNSLFLSDTCNDMSKWYLVPVDGGFHIMNVGAAYSGNHNQAIEFYSGKFTTYGVQDTGIYLFNFYELDENYVPPVPCQHTDTELRGAVNPSCTEKGYSGDLYCSDCGELLEEGQSIDALGHDWDDGYPIPAAVVGMCEYDLGHTIIYTCRRCTETRQEDVPAVGCPSKDYTDVGDATKWYHTYADFVIDRGLMGSTVPDALTFEPNTSCTRSMIVTILYSLAGKPEVGFEDKFPDVKDNQWYTDPVMWAYQNEIVSGYDTGYFGTNDKITREQLAVIFKAFAEKIGEQDTSARAELADFADNNKVTWSKDAVAWAVAAGLISGKPGANNTTILDPQGKASRAEVAVILTKFLSE